LPLRVFSITNLKTSSGKELISLPDKRFGCCNCFVFYNSDTDSVEVEDNPNREHNEGAGPAAMQLIASKSAGKIITAHLGDKAASVAKQLGIEMTPLDDSQRSVEEVIQMIKQNS